MTIDKHRDIFGKNFRYYMEINNKEQKDLINDLGVTRSAISSWYNGRRIPRPEILDALCKYFKIERSDLTEERKEDKPAISLDGIRIIEAYNTKDYLKVLYDEQLSMTPEAARAMLEIAKQMNKK